MSVLLWCQWLACACAVADGCGRSLDSGLSTQDDAVMTRLRKLDGRTRRLKDIGLNTRRFFNRASKSL
jgi:hypothetical protein